MSSPRPPPRPSQSPHATYNPQNYAQTSPQPPHPSQFPPREPLSAGHRPYNPAAYQDASIANAADQIYGPASGSYMPSSQAQSPASVQQSFAARPYQPYYQTSPQSAYSAQSMPEFPIHQTHRHAPSAPVPQRSAPQQYHYEPPHPSSATAAYASTGFSPPMPSNAQSSQHAHTSSSSDLQEQGLPLPTRYESRRDYAPYNAGLHISTTPFPQPPSHLPQRTSSAATGNSLERSDTSGRHPQARPLPGRPVRSGSYLESPLEDDEQFEHPDMSFDMAERMAQDDLFDQVESALNSGSFLEETGSAREHESTNEPTIAGQQQSPDGGHVNGFHDPRSARLMTYYDDDYGDDDSDAEAAAGLEAMRMAEQQEADERRRRSNSGGFLVSALGSGAIQSPSRRFTEEDEEEDYHTVDMGAYGGGYEAQMSYGGTSPESLQMTTMALQNDLGRNNQSVSSRGSGPTDSSNRTLRTSSQTSITTLSTHPNRASARVDEAGTGGFSDPTIGPRKLSFDNDDPAERAYLLQQTQQSLSPEDAVMPQTYYQSPNTASRPLPSVPLDQQDALHLGYQANSQYPYEPGAYVPHSNAASGPYVPRSHSLGSTTTSQQMVLPNRAKTDAEERKRVTMIRTQPYGSSEVNYQNQSGLDLPVIPMGRRLQPSKLRPADYDRCTEPWAISAVISWLRSLAEGDGELKEQVVSETLVGLFTHKIPNLNIAAAEALSQLVTRDMLETGTLLLEEEWIRFGSGTTSGVLYQLTGKGCYSMAVHEYETPGRCYAHHCQATVRKIDVQDAENKAPTDWATFYNLKKEDVEGVDKKAIELQNNLHEIVVAEYKYMNDLKVLRTLYKDGLEKSTPSIMSQKTLKNFLDSVFGKLDAVQRVNEDFLLPQLRYRQKEQGPWITGFSDIFRDWIRRAKTAYIEYTAGFPNAEFLVRQEARENLMFNSFLDQARSNPLSARLSWDNYLKAPITKIQRYSLLLQTVLKNMHQDSEEKTNLQTAIEEIQEATKDCNSRLAEESRKVVLLDLQSRLRLRPEMKGVVKLNLTQWGRDVIHTGDLQREGTNRFTWLQTHAILLDNYLVLAKTISSRDSKSDVYDVSKMPIPMDLLMLDSVDEDPVIKSSVKPFTSVSTVASTQSARPGMPVQSPTSTSLTSVPTNSSAQTMVTTTTLDGGRNGDEKLLYPFRLRHLGREVYTLYAPSAQNRKEWSDKIVEAKTKHAASLLAQNAEPFRLRVIADTAFVYDAYGGSGQRGVTIKGTPLQRALEDVDRAYAQLGRPAPICRARVNCATTFRQPSGTEMAAIGTDYGVYLAEVGNPRGWTRAIPALRVSQVAVLEEFSLFLLISDKSLIAYHLDVVCPPPGANTTQTDSLKKSPQKLSGARDVGFFAVGRMKDRTLVFYEKREGRSSVFKILEPVFQKSITNTNKPSRFLGANFKGHTDFFRDYDDFYIPAECSGLNLFATSLSVATSKGFEILTLDKKTAWSVPDLKQPHVASIAERLRGMKPISMFRLAADGSELLCVYDECAVYVNKYGDVSRSVVMEFVGRARAASLVEGFLILFDDDFVEIRNAYNGHLKQVVAGRDVRCLDNGRGQAGVMSAVNGQPSMGMERTVKFALQHPEQERAQIIVELVLNEGRRD